MNSSIEYRMVLKDYFLEFKRGFRWQRFVFATLIICLSLKGIRVDYNLNECIVGVPILLAMLSGAFHLISLPTMMYLVPFDSKMREEYIQKLLIVKIMIPTLISIIVGIVMLIINPLLLRAVILQIIMVFFITFIMGTLNDGAVIANEVKPGFSVLRYNDAPVIMLCYLGSLCMYSACSSKTIDTWEFIGVIIVVLIVYGTITFVTAKYWKQIRKNFASYEMTIKREVQNSR